MADHPVAALAHDLHRAADQRARHGVAVAVDGHEPIVGHDAVAHHGLQEGRLAGRGRQQRGFLGEAVDGPLVRGAMNAHVGHPGLPIRQLGVEVLQVAVSAARREVAFEVLHAGFDLALGLGPVRLAQPGREAPVPGEGLEGRVQPRLAAVATDHDGAHAVVQDGLATPAEVREGVLVSGQHVGDALVEEALGIGPAAVAQGHHEHMHDHWLVAEADSPLAPVDLRLLGGRSRSGIASSQPPTPRPATGARPP